MVDEPECLEFVAAGHCAAYLCPTCPLGGNCDRSCGFCRVPGQCEDSHDRCDGRRSRNRFCFLRPLLLLLPLLVLPLLLLLLLLLPLLLPLPRLLRLLRLLLPPLLPLLPDSARVADD